MNNIYFIIILCLILITIAEINFIKLKRKFNRIIKDLKRKIEYNNYPEFKEYLKSLEDDNNKLIKYLIKKVTLFIFIILGVSIFFIENETKTVDLYSINYKPLTEVSFAYRGEPVNNKVREFQTAIDFYLSGDYIKADEIFNKELQHDTSPELLLYSGLNKMAKNDFYVAIQLFNKLLYSSDIYTIEAQWYLALCYIKTNQKEKAKNIMGVLSKTEGIYKKNAGIILKNL